VRRLLWIVPTAAVLVLAAILLVAGGGDVRYITRVLVHQDSSISDIGWKAQLRLPPVEPHPLGTGPSCDVPTENAQAVLVVRAGRVVCSWGVVDRPAAAFSISKTVLSLLVSRSDPFPLELPDRFAGITVQELLDMRSGIGFSESVPFPWVNQDQAAVYYATDLARTVVDKPVIEGPPGSWVYNDYNPNLIGLGYQRATGSLLVEQPLRRLLAELGTEDPVSWCVDDQGFPYHESGLVISPRDLAKIGEYALAHPPALGPADPVLDGVGYRNGWWLFGDDLVALGDHGQIMIVSPGTDTVTVRMGDDDRTNFALVRDLQTRNT
jgi:CubicO group peptidase (beta-lactamase class C family)